MALAEETPFSREAAVDQIDDALRLTHAGRSGFPSMTYEEGVVAALEWAIGNTDDIPYTTL